MNSLNEDFNELLNKAFSACENDECVVSGKCHYPHTGNCLIIDFIKWHYPTDNHEKAEAILKEYQNYAFGNQVIKRNTYTLYLKSAFDAGYDFRSSLDKDVIKEFGENSQPNFDQWLKQLE